MSFRPSSRLLAGCLLALPALVYAQAQATVKPDGQFRYALGAGASYASGNTESSSANLSGDVVKATDDSKFQIDARGVRNKGNGQTTAENLVAFSEYDKDLDPFWFDFGRIDYLRDRLANVNARLSGFAGFGRHVLRTDTLSFDLSAGLGYTEDRYATAVDLNGRIRSNYGRAEALLAEESNHRMTATTTLHQKLSVFPALRSGGDFRAIFDSGLAVAMNDALSLTVGFNYRYNRDPGIGVKKYDTLFVTGLSVKID